MQIEIVGPNLPRPLNEQGEMHVHQAGCAHLKRRPLSQCRDGIIQELGSVQAVVESCYGPEAGSFYAENGIPEEDWGTAWREYVGEFHFAPCTSELPEEEPTEPTALEIEADGVDALANEQAGYWFAMGIMAESSRYGTDEQRRELAAGFGRYVSVDGRWITVAGFQAFESALLDWKYATRG